MFYTVAKTLFEVAVDIVRNPFIMSFVKSRYKNDGTPDLRYNHTPNQADAINRKNGEL